MRENKKIYKAPEIEVVRMDRDINVYALSGEGGGGSATDRPSTGGGNRPGGGGRPRSANTFEANPFEQNSFKQNPFAK